MIVYKYFPPFDYVIDSLLEKSLIRFTQPDRFNDPFESLPSFAADKEAKLEVAKTEFRNRFGSEPTPDVLQRALQPYYEELAAIPSLLGKSIVSLCLTIRNNNGLMWSHYADSHRGLALGFDSDWPFFKPGNGKAKQGLREVTYSEKRSSVVSTGPIEDMEAEQETYFFTKSSDWEYEEELRICANTDFAHTKENKNDEDIYLFEFPTECVLEVIMGFRMPSVTRNKIAAIVARKYPNAKVKWLS